MGSSRTSRRASWHLFLLAVLIATSLGAAPAHALAAPAAAAPVDARAAQVSRAATNTLQLSVVSARTEPRALGGAGVTKGAPITTYKYIINVDNTGTTEQRPDLTTGALPTACTPADPGYPDSCKWTSIAGVPGSSPIYTQGDESDFAGGGLNLPAGRYLISVLADGYKLDGAHFTMPIDGPLSVELQPTPLPDAAMRAWVFEDISPVNSAPDAPAEHGLAGFQGHILDYLGEVTTDVYGNPLCTLYVGEDPVTHVIDPNALQPPDYAPEPIPGSGGKCLSDANGDLIIPHLGPNRYALSVTPPDGQTWIQTTTLEGNHDWDSWVMEGSTGYDTEFVQAGEPFPATFFGFVKPSNTLAGGSGEVKGVVDAVKVYVPAKGGLGLPGTIWGGMTGAKLDKPIANPWVALTDLTNGDTAVYVGKGDANGAFDIKGVPDGNYTLSWWDEPQDYIFDLIQVTVRNGSVVDMGILPLAGWWTQIEGYVFNDTNRNGVKDPGEPGVPNFTLTMRKRENSLMDRGATTVTTDATGHYFMENAYPMTQWLVEEAYSDLYYTTGITYQADNQPSPTTVLGSGVDVSVLPIIGLGGRLDWGVHAYDPTGANGIDPRNGGIVGTVSYDTTRNELDPRYAAVEDWQPGVSGLRVDLFEPVDCGTTSAPCDDTGRYELNADGSYARGKLLNTYVTEAWERPRDNCVPRDVDGNPLAYPNDQQVTASSTDCLEGSLMGVQFGPYATGQGTPDANFGAAVDGNYGFGDGCFNGTVDATDPANPVCTGGTFEPLPGGRDYLVHVEVPDDARGMPAYKFTREEDINIANGDQFVPQVPPPACAGALHTVDVAGFGTDGYPQQVGDGSTLPSGVTVPPSTPVDNPTFLDIGSSPYEGQARPYCDTKLVQLNNGKSIVPTFNVFTDVPVPTRFWGLLVDDLNFSGDPKSLLFGEKAGVPFAPIGIYDYTNRLVQTVESDFNGLWDVLLPSSNRISCPTPSGVCANLYRFVGNDPGVPGQLNLNYKPQFRTIAAEFEAIPGLLVPTDLAPTQVGVTVQLPCGQVNQVSCALDAAAPQLLRVSKPYGNPGDSFTITGQGFGATRGNGSVKFDGGALPNNAISGWNDKQITISIPNNMAGGPHQLTITANNGQSTVNGLTFHVIRSSGPQASRYSPRIYEVGPGKPYATIQAAIDAAAASSGDDLVVVYPGQPDLANPRNNPRGAYYENLIITTPVRLQGVGPGGFQGTTFIPGSIVDAGAFGGDTALADAWRTKINSLTWDGNQTVYEGAGIYLLARNNVFTSSYKAMIDGFDIRGGDQMGFPNNINEIGGGPTGLPPNAEAQGGAIFANAYVRYLQITNNVVENNGGTYGTIRIGTPDLPAPNTNQHNENVRVANNRIIHNGGTNLAGGLGLFAGSDNYEVANNDFCGDFSAEYGGALSVYGYSPNGKIHHNRVYFNQSYDEGGGIMIAGQLPANPSVLSPGSGPVDIYNNLIQANLGNDDGGGLRFLMAGNFPMNVYNNMIVNNISTHEGGGVSLNDAPNVRVYNNTIMKNLTTATAVTSNGQPAPAGLSTSLNSDLLQATLPGGSPIFSNPLLFNNVFWDNRAGTRAGGTVTGLGANGAADIYNWDLGVADGFGNLAPTNTVLQTTTGTLPDGSNLGVDPLVAATFDVGASFNVWRNNPNFVAPIMVAADLPPTLMGNYHLTAASPAKDKGAASKAGINAPATDYDNDPRPAGTAVDVGADELPSLASGDLSITKTHSPATAMPGDTVVYTIVASNAGPNTVNGAMVVDGFPAAVASVTWTCTSTGGATCSAGSGSGSINSSVNLPAGGSVTFTANATLASNASGSVVNTATVTPPANATDPNTANNSATDTLALTTPTLPGLTLRDNFNRANANTLGGNWSQLVVLGAAAIRVNSNQGYASILGSAYWNVPTTGFGARQAAAFTFANAPVGGTGLVLKVTGSSATLPTNLLRVQYQTTGGGQVTVATTTNGGVTYTQRGQTMAASFVAGDTLAGAAYADGSVAVFKNGAFVGRVAGTGFTGSGRAGVQLPTNARIDDFRGDTLP